MDLYKIIIFVMVIIIGVTLFLFLATFTISFIRVFIESNKNTIVLKSLLKPQEKIHYIYFEHKGDSGVGRLYGKGKDIWVNCLFNSNTNQHIRFAEIERFVPLKLRALKNFDKEMGLFIKPEDFHINNTTTDNNDIKK